MCPYTLPLPPLIFNPKGGSMEDQEIIGLTKEDIDFTVFLASVRPCSLEVKPGDKDNWIERAGGGLPNYICRVAKGIMRGGKSRSTAIAIAISRIKKWAAGVGDVNADTRAKAAKALVQWEALKAKNKAKKVIKTSNQFGEDYLILSEVESYSLNKVQEAWRLNQKNSYSSPEHVHEVSEPYSYIREVYNDFVIVEVETPGYPTYKVSYTANGDNIIFHSPERVYLKYVNDERDWEVDAGRA